MGGLLILSTLPLLSPEGRVEESARSAERTQHDSEEILKKSLAQAAVCTEEHKHLVDLTHTVSALESVEVPLSATSPTVNRKYEP